MHDSMTRLPRGPAPLYGHVAAYAPTLGTTPALGISTFRQGKAIRGTPLLSRLHGCLAPHLLSPSMGHCSLATKEGGVLVESHTHTQGGEEEDKKEEEGAPEDAGGVAGWQEEDEVGPSCWQQGMPWGEEGQGGRKEIRKCTRLRLGRLGRFQAKMKPTNLVWTITGMDAWNNILVVKGPQCNHQCSCFPDPSINSDEVTAAVTCPRTAPPPVLWPPVPCLGAVPGTGCRHHDPAGEEGEAADPLGRVKSGCSTDNHKVLASNNQG